MATESMPDPGAPPAPDLELKRGVRLGRYELVAPIARGGMAEVWVARQLGDLGFRKLVAVKTIRAEYAENASFRRMFLDEARLAARIHHANVVEVLDLGEEGPIVFQAMTLIEGDSIAGLLRRWHQRGEAGGLPPPIAVRMIADAAAGLHAAHELTDDDGAPLKLVHRDVSPHNILVGLDGVAKIADFGIARALGRLSDETEAGQMKGKFSYLSPEQVARTPPDRRSDVFACGIVLWEMLTGVRLFRGDDPVDTLEKVRTMRIPDVRELAPTIDAAIAEATARALARDARDRFPTAAAFGDALEAASRASTKEVAQLVAALVGADIERRRELVRNGQSARSVDAVAVTPETMGAATVTDAPPTAVTRRRNARIAIGVAIVAVGAGALGSIVLMPREPTNVNAHVPVPVLPSRDPDPAPAPASASATASAPEPAPSPSATASASASAKPATKRAPAPRPVSTPTTPKPKYDNPYP